MNVADMWACLHGHHTDNHWRHVAGWRKIAELAGQHLERLRTYREHLAHAWPPETNAASHAYLAKLNELIDQVNHTRDAAATNQTALSAATQALSSSRAKIEEIHEEYADKLQQKRSWEQTAADPKAAAASRAIHPPVTDAELERLNVQARNIMYGLSIELQQAQTQLRHPPLTPRTSIQTSDPDVYATSSPPPLINPIVPVPTAPAPAAGKLLAKPPRVEPTQTGENAQSSTARRSSFPSNPPSAKPTGTIPHLDTTTDSSPTALPSDNRKPIISKNDHDIRGFPARQPPKVTGATPVRSTPTSGLIGGPPAASLDHPTSHNASARPTQPFGGLIGGGAAGTAPTGGAGSRPGGGRGIEGIPLYPSNGSPPGAYRVTAAGEQKGQYTHSVSINRGARKWSQDDPWNTASGVPPIVIPPDDDGPIDPGPAIGLNR
nr:hypothetical protein [Micromonospora sp. HNM0581]